MSIGRYQSYSFGEPSFIKDKMFYANVKVETDCITKLLEKEAIKNPETSFGKALESILGWQGEPSLDALDYKTTVRYSAVDELGLWNIAEHNLRDYVKLKYLKSWNTP